MKSIHQERLARLNSKIAEIQIGGNSEVEMGEQRDLIVDALNSAKGGIKNGVLPGGGVAMFHAAKLLSTGLEDMLDNEDE